MKRMFQEFFLPLFKKKYQAKELFTSSHSIWSVSEAVFQETFVKKNKSIIENGVEWGVTAKPGHINVTFKSREKQPIQNIEEKLSNDYKELIGDDIFHFIHDMLVSHRKTISTAESCTGGLVGKIITDMPGSSSYYIGSIIAYHNDVKSKLISVKKETIIQDGAVSEDAASEMATGVQNLLSTDYSISVTGIAGPTGGTKDKRVGLVFIGIKSGKEKPEVFRYEFPFNREAFREYVANISLFHLFKKLKKDLGNIL
jgi:nicotinamide-nucleotide amidase